MWAPLVRALESTLRRLRPRPWPSTPHYLLQGVEVAPGEEITLSTIDELKPAVVRAVGVDDYLYLLMPVRVS